MGDDVLEQLIDREFQAVRREIAGLGTMVDREIKALKTLASKDINEVMQVCELIRQTTELRTTEILNDMQQLMTNVQKQQHQSEQFRDAVREEIEAMDKRLHDLEEWRVRAVEPDLEQSQQEIAALRKYVDTRTVQRDTKERLWKWTVGVASFMAVVLSIANSFA